MTIEMGIITLVTAIAKLVLLTLFNRSTYCSELIIISGKIYSNSLMASLNSRAPMFRKEDISDVEVLEFNLPHLNKPTTAVEVTLPSP